MSHFYHGTRTALKPGDVISPRESGHVHLAANVDEAIWDAELAEGDTPARVYIVEPTGEVEDFSAQKSPGPPSMSYRSRAPLRVMGEVTEWHHYHGTRADLKPGDLIAPGQKPNFGNRDRSTRYVYFARTLDAATWGAELAEGSGPGRIYIVEPTGPIEDDPNLTDKRYRGNPTKSFRSRAALRVTGEVKEWKGHAPAAVQAMKDHLQRLEDQGVEPLDD